MVRTLPLNSETRPDLSRVLGIAAVIAVHAFAFMLLLIPMATPPLRQAISEGMEMIWIKPKPQVIEDKAIEDKPKTVVPSTTISKPEDQVRPKLDPPVIVEGGSVATNNSGATDPGPVVDAGPVDTGPVTVGTLAYVKAPPPNYPRAEIRNGVGGTVLLRVLVDVDGRPLEVVVLDSSGNRNLDRAARENVLKNWLFQPAMRDGQPVQAYGKVPVVFSVQ